MKMFIGVIEWPADWAESPVVVTGTTPEQILHCAARVMQRAQYDEGDANESLSLYSPEMSDEDLWEMHGAVREATTEAWLTIYLVDGPGEAEPHQPSNRRLIAG